MNVQTARAAEPITAWGAALLPAHCPHCHAAFRVPDSLGMPLCPNCLAAHLEPQPALEHDASPELIVPFVVPALTISANLERWLRDIPFKHATLNVRDLNTRLVRVFMPLYLADASIWGVWQAQMGFDYLVASTEERFDGKGWVTHRVNETRIRWESRAGEITRKYENISAPALGRQKEIIAGLGSARGDGLPFDTSRAVPFSAEATGDAIVRAPDTTTDSAWQSARLELERRAGNDCQTAAGAEHHEQFVLRGVFGAPNWTLLLVPMYVTSYVGDSGELVPVRVNGQTGFVSGARVASTARAMRLTILLAGLALCAFILTIPFALAAQESQAIAAFAVLLLLLTFALCLAAPVPLIIAWQYNRRGTGGEPASQ